MIKTATFTNTESHRQAINRHSWMIDIDMVNYSPSPQHHTVASFLPSWSPLFLQYRTSNSSERLNSHVTLPHLHVNEHHVTRVSYKANEEFTRTKLCISHYRPHDIALLDYNHRPLPGEYHRISPITAVITAYFSLQCQCIRQNTTKLIYLLQTVRRCDVVGLQ